jgi:hypothetical protein
MTSTDDQVSKLEAGLSAMRAGTFFAAHEYFEAGWHAARPLKQREFFRGLAQLAASHHQLTLGRGRAAARTWCRAQAKLRDILTIDFAAQVDAFHAQLSVSVDGPRFVPQVAASAFGHCAAPDRELLTAFLRSSDVESSDATS